jgi:serine/threonine protein phosphatase 1
VSPPVAIGDLHGRLDLLDALLARFPEREYVFLGDLTDRGPDSRGVVARVRALIESGQAVCLLGNHDQMLIEAVLHGGSQALWLLNGGDATLESYARAGDLAALTADAAWLEANLLPWYVAGEVLYAHALRPRDGDPDLHLWGRPQTDPLVALPPGVHTSVHGHTILQEPQCVAPGDGSVAWFIDTGACKTGRLTALDTQTWVPTVLDLPHRLEMPDVHP